MPDDERTRRRLGDETKSRIADLASGWSVDTPDADPPPAPPTPVTATPAPVPTPATGPTRSKPRTNPPPPPGSAQRKELEEKIIATKGGKDDPTDEEARNLANTGPPRTKPPTAPPPPRSARTTQPPSGSGGIPSPMAPQRSGRTTQPSPPPPLSARAALGANASSATSGAINSPPRPGSPSTPPPPPPQSGRTKAPSVAPPIPASAAAALSARTRVPTAPPPAAAPPASASGTFKAQALPDKAPSSTPGHRYPRAGFDGPQQPFQTESKTFTSEQRTPPVIVDEALSTADLLRAGAAATGARVPVGEFDSSAKTIDQHAQQTIKRDAAEALLAVPDAITPVEDLVDDDDDDDGRPAIAAQSPARGDMTTIDPQTAKFERGDPTQDRRPDATEIQSPSDGTRRPMTGGTLRASAALRRKRGALGDVFYVFTAVFGVRRSRRELAELDHRQGLRQTSRQRHLLTLGRTAIVTDAFDHPALGKAREQLQRIEEERGQHAGAVAASDAELERVRRDRAGKAKEFADETLKADAELAELAKKLEPLEKEAAGVKRRAQELRESLQRITRKIADTEALLVSVKGEKMDKAGIQADIATFKADKQSVLRDEPVIAAQLDALNPRIAAIEANRAELLKKKQEIEKSEQEDQRRTSELLEAIGAKRKVVERAAAEAEAARDTALFDLGDRLYVDRPKMLSNLLSPIDQIDLEIGEGERRGMELREIMSNIDRWKFARGLAMVILAAAILGCFAWWIVSKL